MRCGSILMVPFVVTAFTAVSATGAHAQDWCGFLMRPRSIVQCGYSSPEGCQNVIGQDAICFVNPFVALNTRRTAPADEAQPPARVA